MMEPIRYYNQFAGESKERDHMTPHECLNKLA
jgi:hypothetical protein